MPWMKSIMFVSFFVWGLISNSRMFYSHVDISITGERIQLLTYTLNSWPLSSEGSLTCYTYCDTGHTFILSSQRTSDTNICCWAFISRVSCHYLFKWLIFPPLEIEPWYPECPAWEATALPLSHRMLQCLHFDFFKYVPVCWFFPYFFNRFKLIN